MSRLNLFARRQPSQEELLASLGAIAASNANSRKRARDAMVAKEEEALENIRQGIVGHCRKIGRAQEYEISKFASESLHAVVAGGADNLVVRAFLDLAQGHINPLDGNGNTPFFHVIAALEEAVRSGNKDVFAAKLELMNIFLDHNEVFEKYHSNTNHAFSPLVKVKELAGMSVARDNDFDLELTRFARRYDVRTNEYFATRGRQPTPVIDLSGPDEGGPEYATPLSRRERRGMEERQAAARAESPVREYQTRGGSSAAGDITRTKGEGVSSFAVVEEHESDSDPFYDGEDEGLQSAAAAGGGTTTEGVGTADEESPSSRGRRHSEQSAVYAAANVGVVARGAQEEVLYAQLPSRRGSVVGEDVFAAARSEAKAKEGKVVSKSIAEEVADLPLSQTKDETTEGVRSEEGKVARRKTWAVDDKSTPIKGDVAKHPEATPLEGGKDKDGKGSGKGNTF